MHALEGRRVRGVGNGNAHGSSQLFLSWGRAGRPLKPPRGSLLLLVALALVVPGRGVAREADTVGRPHLELRATPPTSFSPAEVLVIGRLVGGEDLEDFYCPAFEWDWGDGGRSMRESDCPPFDDETKMARRFSVFHYYREAGDFSVRLTLRRAGRTVAAATAAVRVLSRRGEERPVDGPAPLSTVGGP